MTDDKKIKQIQKSAGKKQKNQKYFTIFFVSVIVAFFVIIAFFKLFEIAYVEVEGISGVSSYSEEAIVEFLNVGKNTNLITYDVSSAKRALLYEFSNIDSVNIKKKFPSTLVIYVTENKGTLYIELGDDFFILSSSGRVLEIVNNPFDDGVFKTELVVNGVKRCVCGEDIVFDMKETLEIMTEITSELEKYNLTGKITKLDIRDKFDITLMYDNRFEIIFGTSENVENKIKLFSNMISNKIWEDSTGIIDISNGSEALVKFTGNVAN